ncbi:hypothetical protein HAX54_032331, partial [Datura stramonium]|nr:hypothetical protein [Datura stramonium]
VNTINYNQIKSNSDAKLPISCQEDVNCKSGNCKLIVDDLFDDLFDELDHLLAAKISRVVRHPDRAIILIDVGLSIQDDIDHIIKKSPHNFTMIAVFIQKEILH